MLRSRRFLVVLIVLGAAWIGWWQQSAPRVVAPVPRPTPGSELSSAAVGDSSAGRLRDAFEARQSGLWVEVEATVRRQLADDTHGDRHQRWIVEVAPGHTVLLSHNIDLAPRVPLSEGAQVRFRGRYEWNERGGVVHWTHRDPRGRRDGGWIEVAGRRYR